MGGGAPRGATKIVAASCSRSTDGRVVRPGTDVGAAAAKVSVALVRLGQGNTSNAESVGEGVLEYRIDWGPGYRVYFGRDGAVPVILLTGHQAAPAARHRTGERIVGGLQAPAKAAGAMSGGGRWH